MANQTLHPQFFSTLLPGFQIHLTIPLRFFSKYIEGKYLEKTAKLKSDASDKTWKVNMTGRRLSSGWEEFAVAENFQIGDVVVVRYEGDLVFHVSDLGTSFCEIQDLTSPSNNNNNNVSSKILLKKRVHPRTQVDFSSNDGDDDNEDKIELPKNKKLKKNNPEAESVSPSPNNSSFVALVTASNLRTDILYLPQHFTSSSGLSRNSHKIVLTDEGERSWTLDLRFNNSFDTFFISQGWRSFCNENSQEAGGLFLFKLVSNGEMPVLGFRPTEPINDRRKIDWSEASRRESHSSKEENIEEESSEDESSEEEYIEGESSEDECTEKEESPGNVDKINKDGNNKEESRSVEREKNHLRWRDSTSLSQKQFVTLTITPNNFSKDSRLCLSSPFVRENGINKHREIYLVGKDGKKWLINLRLDAKGTTALGKGWKDFVKANSLKTGDSFTLKLISMDTTPVLSLCSAESISDSILSSQKQFVTLTITPRSVTKGRLHLPMNFTSVNDINEPGMITLSGKDGIKQQTKLLYDKEKRGMCLGNGWKDFVKASGLKTGDSFTLKLVWEDSAPVLSLCTAECSTDRGTREGCSDTNQNKCFPVEPISCKEISRDENSRQENNKEENSKEESSSTSPNQKQFVTLTITPRSVTKHRLHIPREFTSVNDMNDPGMITLSGKDGTKQPTKLLYDKEKRRMCLGNGWKDFVKANGLTTGDSFTLKLSWEDSAPVLSLCTEECNIDRGTGEGCSETNQNKCQKISRDENCRQENNKEQDSKEESSSTSTSQKQFVTLTFTPNILRHGRLRLPAQFVRENGIKPGEIYLLSKDGTKWPVNLQMDTKGTTTLGKGWKDFVEANKIQSGESFKLELTWEDATPMLRLFHSESNSSKANEKESNSTETRSIDSFSAIEIRFVTLTLTHEDVRACQMQLPSQFMRANGINKLGKITLLGKDNMKWFGFLLTRDGTVALDIGWDGFCEANGVKLGESFTLEFICEQEDNTNPVVLKFCSRETNK